MTETTMTDTPYEQLRARHLADAGPLLAPMLDRLTWPAERLAAHRTTEREFRQFTVFFVPVARWKRRRFESRGICGTAVAA